MKPPPLVVVEWLDAWVKGDEPTTLADVKADHKPEEITTIGWVIFRDDSGIQLANEFYSGGYRGRTYIPAGMIHSVTPYKLTKTRTPKVKVEEPPP